MSTDPCSCPAGYCARAAGEDCNGKCTIDGVKLLAPVTAPRGPKACAAIDKRWRKGEKKKAKAAKRAKKAEKKKAKNTTAPPAPGPQLVFRQRSGNGVDVHVAPIVVADSTEARTADHWRRRLAPTGADDDELPPLPPGFAVTLWPGGYGYPGERHAISLDGEDGAPPPADSMPKSVRVEMRDGSTRLALWRDGVYVVQWRPGEDLVQREVAPSAAPRGTGAVARARARQKARAEATANDPPMEPEPEDRSRGWGATAS